MGIAVRIERKKAGGGIFMAFAACLQAVIYVYRGLRIVDTLNGV
jgi:hypothetical protein